MKRPSASTGLFSEENRERFYRVTDFTRRIVHYGWIPLIMLIGKTGYIQEYCAINMLFLRIHSFRSTPFPFTFIEPIIMKT